MKLLVVTSAFGRKTSSPDFSDESLASQDLSYLSERAINHYCSPKWCDRCETVLKKDVLAFKFKYEGQKGAIDAAWQQEVRSKTSEKNV